MPAAWSRSYYVGSIGTVSEATVRRYIANQKTRNAKKSAMIRGLKYRFYPTPEQVEHLSKVFVTFSLRLQLDAGKTQSHTHDLRSSLGTVDMAQERIRSA
jgi:Helix-turn-helix domain/Transposase IS200 like